MNIDTKKGLQSGLLCISKTGDSKSRNSFAKEMSNWTDDGSIQRFIRNAPRDSRYKIDWYHAPHIESGEIDCLDIEDQSFWGDTIAYLFSLGMDESFNPNGSTKW
jgi:hypothetical protein